MTLNLNFGIVLLIAIFGGRGQSGGRTGIWTPLFIALISDAIDYLIPVFGFLPLIGDALDLVTMWLNYRYIGWYASVGAVEWIPLMDILPAHTGAVLAWWITTGRKGGGE